MVAIKIDLHTPRVIQLAKKLQCEENARIRIRIPVWLEESKGFAKREMSRTGVNSPDFEAALRLVYILNRLCPSLHHFHQEPRATLPPKEFNRRMRLYCMENSQVPFTDQNGELLQLGVKRDKANFDLFLDELRRQGIVSDDAR